MRHKVYAVIATGLLLVSGCGQGAVTPSPAPPAAAPQLDPAVLGIPSDAESIADGRDIALTHCAGCHGLDQDASPRTGAPPLRYVLSQRSPESLAEDFRAGIHVGHAEMPDFEFGDLGMDVLLSYLISIQEPPPDQN